MFTSEKVFLEYLNSLKDLEDKIITFQILDLNNLLNKVTVNRLQQELNCSRFDRDNAKYKLQQDVIDELAYLCTVANMERTQNTLNFFRHLNRELDAMQALQIGNACISGVYDVKRVSQAQTSTEIEMLEEAKREGLVVDHLINRGFTEQQLYEIIHGLREGIDVTKYCDERFSADQIKQVIAGLLRGIDVSWYNFVEYDWEQMRQIRVGLEEEIDVTCYASPEISGYYMEVLRLSLTKGEGKQFYDDTIAERGDTENRIRLRRAENRFGLNNLSVF